MILSRTLDVFSNEPDSLVRQRSSSSSRDADPVSKSSLTLISARVKLACRLREAAMSRRGALKTSV